MGVKYTIPFKAIDDVSWKVDILLSTYTVTPTSPTITIRAVEGQCAVLSWASVDQDNPYSWAVTSTLTMNLYNQGQVDIKEFQRATDRQYKVNVYRNSSLFWTGYLDSKDTQRRLVGVAKQFTLAAKDGLTFLDDMPYVHDNLFGTGNEGSRCPMNYFRQILFAGSNLGLPLPIKWTNNLECNAFPDQDVFTGAVQWSTRGEGFTGNSCGYIISNLLKSMQCRIYQSNGTWVIRRVNDSVTGAMDFKRVGDGLGQLVISTGTENIRRKIGRDGYPMVNEDQLMINKPGLKTVKVEYEADVRENILPNGNFDLWSLASPLYWGQIGSNPINIEQVSSLDGRGGYALKVTPLGVVSSDQISYVGLFNPLPVDGYVLLKKIDLNFLFSAQSWYTQFTNPDGSPRDDGETMNMEASPLYLQVVYRCNSNTYYLNEFGFWTSIDTTIKINIPGLKLGEIAQVKFDKFQGIVLPQPSGELQPGDVCDISVKIGALGLVYPDPAYPYTAIYTLDNVTISAEKNNDIYENTFDNTNNTLVETVELGISSSFGGYMVSNYMTAYQNSPNEFHFKDGNFYTGSLTGLTANAMMRFRKDPSEIYTGSMSVRKKEYQFDEIYLIDSMQDTTFMPLSSSYNIEKCEVNLNAIECRNVNAIFTEKFYGSNANILSN